MFLNYNGVNIDNCETRNKSIESEDTKSCQEEDTSSEGEFKGFLQIPVVLVERIDIRPFLSTSKLKKAVKVCKTPPPRPPALNGFKIKTNGYSINIDELTKCSVKVIKSDLEKLRENYARFPNSPTSSIETMQSHVNNIACKICHKVYASEKKLQNHNENKHMIIYKAENPKPLKRVSFSDHIIVHELKEYHKCRKCPKIFENYKSLKQHMKLKHKKRKCYICDYCSKKFVDRMFFKVHIKLHCDVCGLLFAKKKKILEHRKLVCRVVRTHKCRTCSDTFFKFMDLKDHSYEHIAVCYVCDICKDQFQTKCAVAHHISFLHSKVRPKSLFEMLSLGTERLYLCNFCEESSVDRTIIETHVDMLPDLTNRAMTGYKDYYFCDQCLKKFETEKDMLQHKWSHFLKTSDNSQVRPKSILINANVNQNNVKIDKMKTKYNIHEELPAHFKPVVHLQRLKLGGTLVTESITLIDGNNDNDDSETKQINSPKMRKKIISKYQCQNCGKYYSSNYCLTRHMDTQHGDYENLQCKVCEETFVWPSLLRTHKCIRLNIQEMPFDDARPEIHFDNLHEISPSFDDLNIVDSDDYLHNVDFEIPAPVEELRDNQNNMVGPNLGSNFDNDKTLSFQNNGYKVVMQEVPIEF